MLDSADGGVMDKRQAIADFLAAFDGDPIEAVRALRDHIGAQQQSKRPSRVASDAPLLMSIKNITKTYKIGRQKLDVLKGVSVDIRQGEFIAITGASGSGKSTLLQLIGALDKPTSGEIWFKDRELAKLSDGKLSEFRCQTIGFVFQFFYLQLFLCLGSNVAVPGMFARLKRGEQHKRAAELADKVGLSDRLRHFPKELSGGQMQRAAIARALFNKPQILLADEPTGNLDSVNSAAIIELFETIRDELGMTVVIVTHDQNIARRADREIHMKDGVLE